MSFPCLASMSLKSGQIHLGDLSLFLLPEIVGTIGFHDNWHLTLSLVPARFGVHVPSLQGAVRRPGITNIVSTTLIVLQSREKGEGVLASHSVTESLCSLGSYFCLWYHSFSCRSGTAVFPGGRQI